MLLAALAAAALTIAPETGTFDPPVMRPVMRIEAVRMDFTRPDNVAIFVDRVVDESRAFCAVHHPLVTPDRPGDPRTCERIMGDRAVRALPTSSWRRLVRAGGVRAIHHRQR